MDSESSQGIFVGEGTSLRVSGLQIKLGPGGPEVPPVTIELSLGMAPFWLEIALDHLAESQGHHEVVLCANDAQRGAAFAGEFLSGMQAVVAAATAMDAFYAAVKPHAGIPAKDEAAWRKKRTARYKQIAEVLRRAFRLKPRVAVRLRQVLRGVYRFRGLAVHPPGDYSRPIQHPELGVGVEWRYVTFGFANAREIVRAVLAFIALLSWRVPENASDDLTRVCGDTLKRTDPLCEQWRKAYGRLTDDDEFEARSVSQ